MKFYLKKAIGLPVTLFLIAIVTFTAFSVIPGNAAVTALGLDATPEEIEMLKEEMGLNGNVFMRFFKWLSAFLCGNLGTSYKYAMPVQTLITERIPASLFLMLYSFILIVVFSVPMGIWAAAKQGKSADGTITTLSQAGMAVPQFFLGVLLTYLFGIVLRVFNVGGYENISDDPAGFLSYLILPAVSISVPKIGMMTKYVRNAVVAQKKQEYVSTVRSIGASESRIMFKHVFVNAMTPFATMLAMTIAEIFAGSVVVEQVFNIPGLGRLFVTSISNRDYPVVMALVMMITTVVVVLNTLAEIVQRKIDPRIASAETEADEWMR